MTMPSTVAVFCGARFGADPAHRACAYELGKTLADNGIKLVYGGGGVGLMGVVAEAAIDAGGEVAGVIPEFLMNAEAAGPDGVGLTVVQSMHERKRRMFEMSDAFVAIPGGIGTLDETIEIMTWRQLRQHDKPIIILSEKGYWQSLEALLTHVTDEGFADPMNPELYEVAETVDEVMDLLAKSPSEAHVTDTDRF